MRSIRARSNSACDPTANWLPTVAMGEVGRRPGRPAGWTVSGKGDDGYWPTATEIHAARHGSDRGNSGLVINVSFVARDPTPTSLTAGLQALLSILRWYEGAHEVAIREDMKVTASGYDFRPAHAAMQRFVDGNILSGISSAVLIGRDLVDVKCIGWADKEAHTPLRVDHVFRVFSNTTLVTSCAALLLLEVSRFQLDDPIEQFIPQLANRRVLRPNATSLDQTEPADRPITIRHLMSRSSGLSYGVFDPGTLIFNAYNERKVLNPATTLAEMIEVLACRWFSIPERRGSIRSPLTSWRGSSKSSVASVSILSFSRGY